MLVAWLANTAGWTSSVSRYPVHRRLISLNKRNTGRVDPEFNLRHDWNSLLDHPDVEPMTARTKDRWPKADVLVKYLQDFAKVQQLAGRIRFNTNVTNIARASVDDGATIGGAPAPDGGFKLTMSSTAEFNGTLPSSTFICGVIIIASGVDVSNIPADIDGIELADGYEDLPSTGESFEGLSVAVLGHGNSGFGTADAISPFANYVHLFGGRSNPDASTPDGHDFVSWESRYVGDLRTQNAGTLDAYLLKSLDGFGLGAMNGIKMVECGPNRTKICFFLKGPKANWQPDPTSPVDKGMEVDTVRLGAFSPKDDAWGRAFVEKIGHARVNVEQDRAQSRHAKSSDINIQLSGAVQHDGTPGLVGGDIEDPGVEQVTVVASAVEMEALVDPLMSFASRTGDPYPMVFDKVIRCLGWKHGRSMYDSSATPWMQANGKYPILTEAYESAAVRGMYFAGQLGHGKDFKRSAGGFIHGFRYTARALFRILESRHHSDSMAWPAREHFLDVATWDGKLGLGNVGCNAGDQIFEAPGGCNNPPIIHTSFERLLNKLFTRIDTASGPYQMVAVLGDGVVFRCSANASTTNRNGVTINAEYVEEMPFDFFNKRFAGLPRLFWHFGYRQQRRSLHGSRSVGTFFQVQLWYFPGDCGCKETTAYTVADAAGGPDDDSSGPFKPTCSSGRDRPDQQPLRKELVQIHENKHTRWGQPSRRRRIGLWLHNKLKEMRPEAFHPSATTDIHWLNPGLRQEATHAEDKRQMAAAAATTTSGLEVEDSGRVFSPSAESNADIRLGLAPISINWGANSDRASKWEGGHVDINFSNQGSVPAQLWQRTDPSGSGQFIPVGNEIKPGSGFRVLSHEFEGWEARSSDGVVLGKWWIDRADGLVQDILIRART
jgi:hypothetical protein